MAEILVVGGAGFIGREFLRQLLAHELGRRHEIRVLDALTYAADFSQFEDITRGNVDFHKCDIADFNSLSRCYGTPEVALNFAAETHVDNSIQSPGPFARTNYLGTANLLQMAVGRHTKRFIQISTDEVYGSLLNGEASEAYPLKPSSPYSASKAAADLLVEAFAKTYDLSVTITRTCNNFGPGQHVEKLIPKAIEAIHRGADVPLYGSGDHIREWIDVRDNASALIRILEDHSIEGVLNIGSGRRISNKEVLEMLFRISGEGSYTEVADRPGHDFRYALDSSKFKARYGMLARRSLEDFFAECFPSSDPGMLIASSQ